MASAPTIVPAQSPEREQRTMSGQSFQRTLRNPWVVISAMGHAVVLAIISVIVMTTEQAVDDASVTTVNIADVKQDEPEVKPPEVVDREEVPKLQEADIQPNELQEWVDEDEPADPTVDPNLSDMPPGDTTGGTAIGLAGPGHHGIHPSPFGGHRPGADKFGGRFAKGKPGGQMTAEAVRDGLAWLKNHQDEDGRWDADEFMKHDVEGPRCDGAGNGGHDVGVTALGLLAFLGEGNTMRTGPYKNAVRKAVKWLRAQQREDGLFGTNATHDFIYDHSLAALAMVEGYGLSEVPALRDSAQRGINYLEAHRNPYMVWRYQPRDNDNDTSVTGWCVMAYKSAQDFKLDVNAQALKLALTWFDQVTDPITGRCGYTQRGESSSRRIGDHAVNFPTEKGEALTAVGLMCRFFLDQDPEQTPVMLEAANRILEKPPVWNDKDGSIDHYYWYYGTYALYQMGKRHWTEWSQKLTGAVVKTQRKDGNFKGSWDPIDAWGEDGGRVYSTAILVLTLEAYYRYPRVFVR